MSDSKAPCGERDDFSYGQKAFAIIKVDKDGFAKFVAVRHDKPSADVDFLRVTVSWRDGENVHLEVPFERFYVEENDAKRIERAYRKHTGKKDTYLLVKILDGYGVIENLVVGGEPVAK